MSYNVNIETKGTTIKDTIEELISKIHNCQLELMSITSPKAYCIKLKDYYLLLDEFNRMSSNKYQEINNNEKNKTR